MTDPTYIKTPFAAQGDKSDIPDDNASSVNWTTGFTENYSKKLTEAGAKLVSRKELNGILNAITKAIRYIQIGGVAIWNNTFQTSFQSGSIIWKKNADGYWLILEAKHDSPRNPDSYPNDWNWHTIAQYVNNKMKLDSVVATELSVGGMTLKNGAAQGCPTPTNGTDFANKQYVDGAVNAAVNRILIGSDTTARKQSISAGTEYTVQASDSGKLLIITTQAQRESYARIQIYSESIGAWLDVSGSTTFDQSMSIHTFNCYCKAGLKFKVVAGKTPSNTYAYYIG